MDINVFAGSASPLLTQRICEYLGIEASKGEVLHFSEGTTFVRVLENVRGRECYVIQSTAAPANDNFMELLFWIDALNRASAESVTVIVPYFAYGKGDKKDEPRVSIRARVCADAIEAAGADRVVMLDLHAAQLQGFFKIPVDDLYALPVLCEAIASRGYDDLVIVAPDAGFAKKARRYATHLGAQFAIADKVRTGHDEQAEVVGIMGEVAGRTAVIVDDFIISAGTLIETARSLAEYGAREVHAVASQGVFSVGSMDKIEESELASITITDAVEQWAGPLSPKIDVVSIAPLLGEAIRRIHQRESISVLFPN